MATQVTTVTGTEIKSGDVFFEFSFRVPIVAFPSVPFPPPLGFSLPEIPGIPSFGSNDSGIELPTLPSPSLPGIPFPPSLSLTPPELPSLPSFGNNDSGIQLPSMPDLSMPGTPFPPPLSFSIPELPELPALPFPVVPGISISTSVSVEG